METYSLRIESLLCKLCTEVQGLRVLISQNPYREIYKVLEGRISQSHLQIFRNHYQGIEGYSIAELQEECYDIERLISDLGQILNEEARGE